MIILFYNISLIFLKIYLINFQMEQQNKKPINIKYLISFLFFILFQMTS